jgi:hypothetical protein
MPGKRESALYRGIWRVVMGAVTDAFKSHPEYLTPAGSRSAHFSVAKRVTGSVVSFLDEREGRAATADKGGAGVHPAASGGGTTRPPKDGLLGAAPGSGDATSLPTIFTAIPHPRLRGRWTLACSGPPPAFVGDPGCYREFASEARATAAAQRLNVAMVVAGPLP